ncbi:hypothetical protein ACFYN0_26280 [Streptomyces sp. NPDC006704]|uniref:hypothetical protein n=1 Tax=Streptomyces sp. NPDC006704 TaxID=3364760 RepID=UPI0036CB0485
MAQEKPWTTDDHGYKVHWLSEDLVEICWVYNIRGQGPVGPDTYHDLRRSRLTQLASIVEGPGCSIFPVPSQIDGRIEALIAHSPNFEAAAEGVILRLRSQLESVRSETERLMDGRIGWPQITTSGCVLEAATLYKELAESEQILAKVRLRHPEANQATG